MNLAALSNIPPSEFLEILSKDGVMGTPELIDYLLSCCPTLVCTTENGIELKVFLNSYFSCLGMPPGFPSTVACCVYPGTLGSIVLERAPIRPVDDLVVFTKNGKPICSGVIIGPSELCLAIFPRIHDTK